eukprot:gene13629-16663_t
MMRILLFVATNLAVLVIASITLKLLGVDRFTGQNYGSLLVFCAVFGFAGSLVSLFIGMIMVNLLEPGKNLNMPLPPVNASTGVSAGSFSLNEFIKHAVPDSAVGALANNEVLQIVIFAIFFGVAAASVGHKARVLVALIEEASHVVLKITGYVMSLAPLAVFSAIAAIIT